MCETDDHRAQGRGTSAAAPSAPVVARAHARLPGPEREVLAFVSAGLSYELIGGLIGVDTASVAELAAVGRLRLHDELFGTRSAPRMRSDPACLGALAAATARADRQQSGGNAAAAHLTGCPRCVLDLVAILTAARCYRDWTPDRPGETLRRRTLAQASALLEHDAALAAGTDRDDA